MARGCVLCPLICHMALSRLRGSARSVGTCSDGFGGRGLPERRSVHCGLPGRDRRQTVGMCALFSNASAARRPSLTPFPLSPFGGVNATLSPCLTHAYIRLRLEYSLPSHSAYISAPARPAPARPAPARPAPARPAPARPVRTIYLAYDGGATPQTPLSLRFPHPSMSQNGTSATTLLRINLRQLREQLTQDGGDLGHLGTGGVFGAPAAGE